MDLSVLLKGQKRDLYLKNPSLAASGTFGYGLEFRPYGDLASLGGIVVKGLSLKPRRGNPSPRVCETASGMLNSIGLQNDGVDNFLRDKLPLLPWKETAIIANMYATSVDEFAKLAAILNAAEGVAALEVNVSCPNVREGGIIFGSDPDLCAQITGAVRKNAPDKFVIVKLSPNVTDITLIGKAAENAGADCVSAINTLSGMAIDVQRRKPVLANVIGGLSGPAIKPVALRCVWQLAGALKIPVIGIGGICSTRDILEFLLAGASAIQVGTGNFARPDMSFKLAAELPDALRKAGAASVKEITRALKTD
ncbi:MAG: dihydroorotate dehydrogenase [Desulfovibrio sp.]|nr:dihydroorotate dehydrogenase [Desulfovibrio sp.]